MPASPCRHLAKGRRAPPAQALGPCPAEPPANGRSRLLQEVARGQDGDIRCGARAPQERPPGHRFRAAFRGLASVDAVWKPKSGQMLLSRIKPFIWPARRTVWETHERGEASTDRPWRRADFSDAIHRGGACLRAWSPRQRSAKRDELCRAFGGTAGPVVSIDDLFARVHAEGRDTMMRDWLASATETQPYSFGYRIGDEAGARRVSARGASGPRRPSGS